jgi:hypothetical protein
MHPKKSQRFDKNLATRWLIPVLLILCLLGLVAVLAIALIIPAG